MKFCVSYIFFIVAIIILNLLHQDQQEKISSSNLNELIYSGFLQSQSRVFVTEKIILSCKFKSMNRKSTKSPKLKDKISKNKI
tara:strand:- start:189 stop:437 length:249 start_codon:yes stop_codon:yes gene_type:complete